MSNPFKGLKATAVIGKPLPNNFDYAAEYAVETPNRKYRCTAKK